MRDIPEIPKQIVNAINDGTFAVFVGAGISRIAGLPSWSDLARNLIIECQKFGLLSYVDKEIILEKIKENKHLISIAYTTLCAKHESIFFDIMYDHLNLCEISEEGKKIFNWLKDTTALVLTTNADQLLDEQYEASRVFSDPSNIKGWSTDRGCLVHLHGIRTDMNSLVFTVRQYLERYRMNDYQNYLRTIFATKTVLFIGYGLAEFELLDYIILKSSANIRHFVLSPYFSYEEPATRALGMYYEELGIQQIPYCIDKNGYSDLAEVLNIWMNKIMLSTNLPSMTILRIRELAKQTPTEESVAEALQLVKTNSVTEKELFNHILRNKLSVEWLLALKDSFCFDPHVRNPEVVEQPEDGRNFYRAPVWHGLQALSSLQDVNPNNELHEMIINIINLTTVDAITNPLKLNNWITAINIAKIFFAIDPSRLIDASWEYMQSVSSSDFTGNADTFVSEFIDQIEAVSAWPAQYIGKVLSVFLEATPKKASNQFDNYLDDLTKKCIDTIVPLAYPEIVEICIQNIERIYSYDTLAFADVGAFAKYPDIDGHEDWGNLSYPAVIVIWLRRSIDMMTPSEAMILAARCEGSEMPLLRRVALYCISSHFDDCNSFIFESSANPFNDKEVYSDLFDMLIVNSDRIDKSHIQQIATWIENADFGTDKVQVQNFRRALIYWQLAKIDEKYISHWNDFSSSVEREYDWHEAYNVSKHMFATHAEWVEPDLSIVQCMEKMTAPEIFNYLNAFEYNWKIDEWSVGRSIEKFFPSHQTILLDHVDLFVDLKEELLPYLIHSMEEMNLSRDADRASAWTFLNLILSKRQYEKQARAIYCDAFRRISKLFVENKLSSYYDPIICTLMKWISKNRCYDCNETDYSILVLNEPYAMAVSLLIETAASTKQADLVDLADIALSFINDQLLLDDYNWSLRMAVSYRIGYISYLSQEWIEQRLPLIFSDKNTVAIAAGYIMASSWTPKLYSYLSSRDYFESFLALESTSFMKDMKRSVASISIHALIDGQDDLSKKEGTLHSVINHLSTSMLISALDAFKRELHKENLGTAQADHVGDMLAQFLQAIGTNNAAIDRLCISIILECMAALNTIPNMLWHSAERLIKEADDVGISGRMYQSLEKTVNKYPLNTAKLLEASLKSNARIYMSSAMQKTLSDILTALKSEGYLKEALCIKNLLISRGNTSFAEG